MNKYKINFRTEYGKEYKSHNLVPYITVRSTISRKGWFNDKLTLVFRDLRKAGFYAKKNSACCNSCTEIPEEQLENGKYTYIHDQAMYDIKNGDQYVYLPFSGAENAWQIIAMCYKHDLNVFWNGDVTECILVTNYDMNPEYLELYKIYQKQQGWDNTRKDYSNTKKRFQKGICNDYITLYANEHGEFANGQSAFETDDYATGYSQRHISTDYAIAIAKLDDEDLLKSSSYDDQWSRFCYHAPAFYLDGIAVKKMANGGK